MKKMYLLIVLIIASFISLKAEEHYNFQPTNGPYGGYIRSFCYDSTTKDVFANADHIYKLNRNTNMWEKQFDNINEFSDYFYNLIYTDSIYFVAFNEGHS